MWRWPFRRSPTIEVKTAEVEQRIREAEWRSKQEQEEMTRRLRYLEVQAELMARQHLPRFTNGDV